MSARKYLDHLFISKVRIKALQYFFFNKEPIHLRAAVRELNEEINAVRRELSRMAEIGLLTLDSRGNKKYFMMNPDFLFYEELLSMMHKSFGLGGEIVRLGSKLGQIQFAVITQGFTRNQPYGSHAMDLIVVGDNVDMNEIDSLVTKEEQKMKRHINYTVLSPRDFDIRKKRRDPFMMELLMQERVMLIGSNIDFLNLS